MGSAARLNLGRECADVAASNIAQSENISFDNLKNGIIYGSNMASFCVEKFGPERMINLQKEEVLDRLQQFKALTQFDIALQNE